MGNWWRGGGVGICFDARHTSLVHTASAPLSPFPSCIPSFILGKWVGFWGGGGGGRYGGGGRGVGEGDLVFDKMDWGGSRKREREKRGGATVERTSRKIGRREQMQ